MNYRERPAWRNDWSWFAVIGLCIVGPGRFKGEAQQFSNYLPLLALPAIVRVVYKHFVWLFTVDDQKIESRHGIIARRLETIRIEDLRNVSASQSVWQRVFMLGDVGFSSAGGGAAAAAKGWKSAERVEKCGKSTQNGGRNCGNGGTDPPEKVWKTDRYA